MTSVWKEHHVRADQLDQLGCMCGWGDCDATFNGDMPDGWRWLLAYWAPEPPQLTLLELSQEDIARDAVLCPQHAAAFERLLKELPARQLNEPSVGSA
jgi:hypothetical protein